MPGKKKITKLDRCVEDVKKQGKSEDSAYAICQASINKGKTSKSIEDVFFDDGNFELLDSVKGSAKDVERTSSGKIKYRGTIFPGFNKPRKSTNPKKKKMVLAKSGDKIKVVHYGATGYKHNYSPEAKRSFRARHKCGQQKDKLSAAYWACRDLWPTGSTKKSLVYKAEMKGEDPCWEGYEMVGFKTKNNRRVPNCVPKKSAKKAIDELGRSVDPLGIPALPAAPITEEDAMRFPEIMHGENKTMKIVIPVPKHIAEDIKMQGGVEPCDMHVTLAYLPQDTDITTLRMVASEFARSLVEPLNLTMTGVGRFNHEGKDVLYISVDCPELAFQRERLIAMLEGNGVVVDHEHGFDPHITIAYIDKEDETPRISESYLCSWMFYNLEVWQGPFKYKYHTIHSPNRGVFE